MTNPVDPTTQAIRRRTFLKRTGIGVAALGSLLNPSTLRAAIDAADAQRWTGVARPNHLLPRAKRIIWLYMAGGPSHLESFDHKPKLAELDGKPMPESFTQGQPIAQLQGKALKCYGPQAKFIRYGQSGQEISEFFPHIGSIADDICIVRSLKTEQINHDPAHTFMNTGTSISGRPAMGSWVTYGLGADTQSLPGFIVLMSTGKGGQMQPIAQRQWHSGFLPSRFQGVAFRSTGDPVLYIRNPHGVDQTRQRDVIDAVSKLNAMHEGVVQDPEIATRVAQYEMAFRMQMSVPELMDIAGEPQHILDMYGVKSGADGSFNYNCLLARRLAERGVRFIQLYHRDWDHHGAVRKNMDITAKEVDQPAAALINDLEQRGMLDDTIVVYGGEFGRTPMAQGDGRDHHIKGFSMWMAGGGIKGGVTHGATDDLGYHAQEDIVHVHDLHATLLHLMGIDHKQLTYRFQGRDFRLTDVHGEIVRPILA